MAIKRGHRLTVPFGEVFPQRLILMGEVEPVIKYNEDRNAQKVQEIDVAYDGSLITGLRKWKILVTDPDADRARGASFEVILLTDHQPVPPESAPELIPGTGMRLIELEGLTVEARVMDSKKDQFSWQGWVFRATGFVGDNNTPKAASSNGAKAGA